VEVFRRAQWRSARSFADDRSARNRRRDPRDLNLCHLFISPSLGGGRLGFVVTGILDREQDSLIGFVSKQPQ
jgi:hypothetical protein